MTKRTQPKRVVAQPKMVEDPAHAPGKHHIAHEHDGEELHRLSREQQQLRTPTAAPPARKRRSDRGH